MPFLIRVWIIIITPQIVYIVLFPLDDVWILIILVPRQSSHALWIVLGANEMITIFNYWFKADAMEIAKYALDNWTELRDYTPMDTIRYDLKTLNRQFQLAPRQKTATANNLIALQE